MLLVALESSARAASVAVDHDGRTAAATLHAERAHASDLFPELERLLAEVGASPREITAVLVGLGPGSYTGLRVGIATALGLARGSGAALRGVPSGEALAFGQLKPGAEAVHLLDARSQQLYFAHYRRTADDVEVLRPPCVLQPGELASLLPPRIPIFADASAADAAQLSPADRNRTTFGLPPDARDLLTLGARRLAQFGGQTLDTVEPLYLRPFAAQTRRR